jgi:hypothetical protein
LIESKWFSASYSAVSNLLKSEGFESPKCRKRKPKTHKTRERRASFGELIQIDGTPHDWFGTGKKACLHVAIDDATGKLTGLHLSQNECLDGYFSITRQTIERFGVPQSFYGDGLSILFSNKRRELSLEEQLMGIDEKQTQFGEVCKELGIGLIQAHSPQAKGRVERANETLQGRLIVEFRLRDIHDMDAANKFLENEYIDMFNREFGKEPRKASVFIPLPTHIDLDELLTFKTLRKVDRGCVFSLNNVKFRTSIEAANKMVQVLISKKLGIVTKLNDRFYDVEPLTSVGGVTGSDSVEMLVKKFVHFYTLKDERICVCIF